MKINELRNFTLAGIATAVMLGCGGGDPGGGNGPTGITTVGAVTGFGSVYVNGVEYETDTAEYEVEDDAAFDDSALKVGMVVKVTGSVNSDGRTGTANQIIYEDELEGPVKNLVTDTNDVTLKHLTIFDVPVTVSSVDTHFDNQHDATFSFASLANDDHVEVSGYFNGQALQATYIKKEATGDNDFEVKGEVTDIVGDTYTLTTFFNASITFTLAANASIPSSGIQIGQYVEVEGIPTGPSSLEASKVELEDRHHLEDDEGEVEIRGVLSYDAATDSWFLNDIPLDLNGDIEYEPAEIEDAINDQSADGMMVKVEGDYRNGVLVVDEIEDKQDSLEFKGTVAALSASGAKSGTLTIAFGNATGTVTVTLDSNTMYPGDDSLQQFDLRTDVPSGAYVEVKAMQDQLGQILATRLQIENSPQEYEVEGPLDSFVPGNTITAMNVTFTVNGSTVYLPRQPVTGDIVDITDVNGDGLAEQVEIED